MMIEFTFYDDSIGGGYRLPEGSEIHYLKDRTIVYDKDGKLIADILDENAGPWFSPTQNNASAHRAPHSLEVPSGSYVFHEENGATVVAHDLEKKDIINRIAPDAPWEFPPSSKGSNSENVGPADPPHRWVTWHEIPITGNIIKVSADWSVEKTPTPYPEKPLDIDIQGFHTFPGINIDECILQPVLTWNCIYDDNDYKGRKNPKGQKHKWSISSNIAGESFHFHSPSVVVDSPSVHGDIIWRAHDSTPHWSISTSHGGDSPTKSILNDVKKTAYLTQPLYGDHNASVVFALEKNQGTLYPRSCNWPQSSWPDGITFKNIKIEPSGHIDKNKARNVVACTQPECDDVKLMNTTVDSNNDVTIQFKDPKRDDPKRDL